MFLVESRAWAAFIGPEESMQSRDCICDTHLLRSVIKLCKLGRLDKPLRTHFNPYVNNAMKMHWTDQKLKRRMTKEEESTATCIPRRSLVQDWLYYINIRLTVYRKPELAQRPCKSSLYRSNFSICTAEASTICTSKSARPIGFTQEIQSVGHFGQSINFQKTESGTHRPSYTVGRSHLFKVIWPWTVDSARCLQQPVFPKD